MVVFCDFADFGLGDFDIVLEFVICRNLFLLGKGGAHIALLCFPPLASMGIQMSFALGMIAYATDNLHFCLFCLFCLTVN